MTKEEIREMSLEIDRLQMENEDLRYKVIKLREYIRDLKNELKAEVKSWN